MEEEGKRVGDYNMTLCYKWSKKSNQYNNFLSSFKLLSWAQWNAKIGRNVLYLLELLLLDPGVFENQYTTLLHHPGTYIGSPYYSVRSRTVYKNWTIQSSKMYVKNRWIKAISKIATHSDFKSISLEMLFSRRSENLWNSNWSLNTYNRILLYQVVPWS